MTSSLTRMVTLAATLFLLAMAVGGVFAVLKMNELEADTTAFVDTITVETQATSDYFVSMSQVLDEGEAFVRSGVSADLEEAHESLVEAQEAYAQLSQVNVVQIHRDPAVVATYTQLRGQQKDLLNRAAQAIAEMETASSAAALSTEVFDEIEGDMEELKDELDVVTAADLARLRTRTHADLQASQASLRQAGGLLILMTILTVYLLHQTIVRPINELSRAAAHVTAGDLQQAVRPTGVAELGGLQQNFNMMTAMLAQRTQDLVEQVRIATEKQVETVAAQEELAARLKTIEDQQHVIQQLSVPILPLTGGTLVMPLIGLLDHERMQLVRQQALQAVETSQARHLIMDITGVPLIDADVAQGLVQIGAGVRLLGGQPLLVGIRPEVAQTLASLSIPLSTFITRATLQNAIAYTLTMLEH
jgi:rsbT co-antagonist protein RsbR